MSANAKEISPLKKKLSDLTRCGELWSPESDAALRCFACGHRCLIHEGRDGICKVRSNVGGELRVPWGYVGGLQVDPIEKKPFFHVLPGAQALSFGMLGCDYHCAYCQNWFTSQTFRDAEATAQPQEMAASELVTLAERSQSKVLTSTYNEPLITSEWAVHIFKEGKKRGLRTSYVSNGNATREVLEYLRPHVDYYKIDLKGFDDKHYRKLGGVLKTVTDSIEAVVKMGFWCEIVTLIIPGFNDDPAELKALCEFLAGVSCDLPWHATAFHPDYKMGDSDQTSVKTLLQAAEIAKAAGLNYVYLGNLPGQVGNWENTYCPHCHLELVSRRGFIVTRNVMTSERCPGCQATIPGRWV